VDAATAGGAFPFAAVVMKDSEPWRARGLEPMYCCSILFLREFAYITLFISK
jgi:hypothetical protein